MNILALFIALFSAIIVAIFTNFFLKDKLEDFDIYGGHIYTHYPNIWMWEYIYVKSLSVVLGIVQLVAISSIFVGDVTLFSLIGEVIVALVFGFVLIAFISQILFTIVIDGVRDGLSQRIKCLDAIERKKAT